MLIEIQVYLLIRNTEVKIGKHRYEIKKNKRYTQASLHYT